METANHYFYVLLCRDNTYYAGYTNNLEKRIKTHNEGKGAKYTRARRPVQLIYKEVFTDKSQALKAEYAFKQLSRKEKESYMRKEIGVEHVAAKKL
ncbi:MULTISPECIES: GIY-YIG nuclease family protein [unclassified Niallia]|uniref:GIY-YIG nuclease family protein n=1 Tax=unclassified Niallia TaxID=2837522 RepID=UPI001EDB10C3|nr:MULTISPECIES: GIY-YIG nuclease family protein [unclassified Niallia]MDL0437292.1 GIY-YIG nuclease family protein [Niallia sp. SS-2023]UPO87711.1 GIY-YIG nuclease family protein [Niallia sp. Man26]